MDLHEQTRKPRGKYFPQPPDVTIAPITEQAKAVTELKGGAKEIEKISPTGCEDALFAHTLWYR